MASTPLLTPAMTRQPDQGRFSGGHSLVKNASLLNDLSHFSVSCLLLLLANIILKVFYPIIIAWNPHLMHFSTYLFYHHHFNSSWHGNCLSGIETFLLCFLLGFTSYHIIVNFFSIVAFSNVSPSTFLRDKDNVSMSKITITRYEIYKWDTKIFNRCLENLPYQCTISLWMRYLAPAVVVSEHWRFCSLNKVGNVKLILVFNTWLNFANIISCFFLYCISFQRHQIAELPLIQIMLLLTLSENQRTRGWLTTLYTH